MKKMYNESLKHNTIIVLACLISCSLIYSVDSYLTAKKAAKMQASFHQTETPTTSYFSFVSNGFTLN